MTTIKQLDFDELKKWMQILQHYWFLVVFIIGGVLAFAFIYNYTTPPNYAVSTQVLIKEDPANSAAQIVMGQQIMTTKINNELAVLRSYEFVKTVVEACPFIVSYFENNKFRTSEQFPSTGYEVVVNKQHVQIVGVPIYISFTSDSMVNIKISSNRIPVYDFIQSKGITSISLSYDTTIRIGENFKTDFCDFTIQKNAIENTLIEEPYFTINSIESNVEEFKNIEATTQTTSGIVTLSIQTTCPQKGVFFLNKLLEKYFEHTIKRENVIANNTLILIDALLGRIRDSLFVSEDLLKNFKKKKRLLDIDYQSQKSFGNLTEEEKNRAALSLKQSYLQRSLQLLKKSTTSDALALPASFDLSDPFLDKLVEEYNETVALKKEIKFNTLKDPPYLSALEARISNARNAVIDVMQKMDENLSFSITEINRKIESIYSNIDSIPETNRDLVRIERRYHLHEGLYVYLLQKQSEMQIVKAGNIPINETLEYARPDNCVFLGPNKIGNIVKALFIGMLLSIGLIYVLRLFHNKISTTKEIESISESVCVFASIYHNNEDNYLVMQAGSHTPVAESFRTLLANFQFLPKPQSKGRVSIVTSSDMGEGKSFVSLNLAYTLASNNKTVALLGLDLRRPSLHTYWGMENTKEGLSSYLSGVFSLDQIIKQTDNPLLHFYNAGPIPPNPTELLNSDAMRDLVAELRGRYDYVIIDTPPVGRVGDFLYVSSLADTIFYIVRHNVSSRPFVKQQIDLINQKGIKNISIILNDCPIKKRKYGYYTYGYGASSAS